MKKFLYCFIYVQIFLLIGGFSQVFASTIQGSQPEAQYSESIDFTSNPSEFRVSERSPFKDKGNVFFDLDFMEVEEEETSKSILSYEFVDARNCVALLLWAKSFWATELPQQTNQSSHIVCGSISTPYYLSLQTFRI